MMRRRSNGNTSHKSCANSDTPLGTHDPPPGGHACIRSTPRCSHALLLPPSCCLRHVGLLNSNFLHRKLLLPTAACLPTLYCVASPHMPADSDRRRHVEPTSSALVPPSGSTGRTPSATQNGRVLTSASSSIMPRLESILTELL